MARRIASFAAMFGLQLCLAVSAHAESIALNPSHPQHYTVVRGDTLWGISAKFLRDPWQWARVWTINPQVRNPDLIYPGDVIVLSYVHGKPMLQLLRKTTLAPEQSGRAAAAGVSSSANAAASFPPSPGGPTSLTVVTLRPQIRSEPIKNAIPTINPEAIAPFLSRPLVVSRDELNRDPYITKGLGGHLAFGSASLFYARGFGPHPARHYEIFRRGQALKNPDSGETLGYEARYIGRAKLLRAGDPAKLVVTSANEEVLPMDRLVAVPRQRPPLPYYFPHPPRRMVRGSIISAPDKVAEFGAMSIVAIDLGQRDGMTDGDVLRILRSGHRRTDPLSGSRYRTPDETRGLLMVFRIFNRVSYGLIMSASGPISIGDRVVTP